MSRRSLFLLLRFLLLPAALWPPSSSAFHSPQVDIQSQLAMADELPREEIALLYQRLSLKSGEAPGSGRTIGRGTGGKNGTKMGTTAHQGRRKIAPPVVIAVFSSSASAPTSRRPPSSSSSSPSMAPATTGIPSPSPNQSSGAGASSAGGKDSLWPPSFLQVSRVTAIVLVGVFFSVATVVGNALVMLSICVDRKLQTISNFFLFSLAVADLTIGLISIPLMTLYTANESWSFGYNLCQFWLCLDYLMCNASVLNLLLISFDRYFSVTLPLTYRPKRTTRKALMWIAGAYLISLILWPPLIIFWPLMEGRFVVEESHFCVVQFLALGDARDWLKQLATVVTASLAFYIPVTIMIVLYYRVYLETRRRQKELRKLQDGQQLFSPKLTGTSALHSLLLPLAPLIRGLQHSAGDQPFERSIRTISSVQSSQAPTKSGRINFMDFVGNISTLPTPSNFKKKERFSLLKYCTGKAQTDISSEDSVDDGGGLEETCGLTTSNLDSILADNTVLAVELAKEGEVAKEEGAAPSESGKCPADLIYFNKEGSAPLSICTALELGRTSRPASVHTYNSIVIIEYPDGGRDSQRPSVRLSSQAEVESLSARNSVERRLEPVEELTKTAVKDEKDADAVNQADSGGSERQQLRLTKSCPSGPPAQLTTAGRSQQQQNGLMKKSEIQLLREEQMRRSEKERRRNERKQESKAAKTLSAILFAFIITWTPYNVIVCLEAFYPNSVPASLFTLSYFLSYINSTINPLCYALCNARFRMTYLKILKCKWGRRNSGGSPFDGAFAHHHHHQQKQGGSGQRTLLKGRHRSRTSTTMAQ